MIKYELPVPIYGKRRCRNSLEDFVCHQAAFHLRQGQS